MTYTISQKKAIYKYVDANREKINLYNKIRAKDYRTKNAEIISNNKKKIYRYNCECKRLLNILIE
jgi:hypothetical protein